MQTEIEVMRVLRVPPLGKLVVQIGNRRHEKLEELPAGAMQQRVMAAIGELIVFAGGYQALVDAGLAPAISSITADAAANAAANAGSMADALLAERQAAFLNSLEQKKEETGTPTLPPTPHPRRFPLLGRTAPPPPPTATTPAMDIAAQINTILQRHLEATPQLAGRRVRLVSGAAGTLQIDVDGRYYENPGQIPDRDVQALIKRALHEWDKK